MALIFWLAEAEFFEMVSHKRDESDSFRLDERFWFDMALAELKIRICALELPLSQREYDFSGPCFGWFMMVGVDLVMLRVCGEGGPVVVLCDKDWSVLGRMRGFVEDEFGVIVNPVGLEAHEFMGGSN